MISLRPLTTMMIVLIAYVTARKLIVACASNCQIDVPSSYCTMSEISTIDDNLRRIAVGF